MSEPGGTRIGDAERQAVVDLLRHHTSEGRLTLDEFSDLVGDVYAALTRDDLDTVIAKLPEGVRPSRPDRAATAPVPGPDGADARVGRPPRRRFVAVMCGTQARGHWRAPPRISAFAFWGHVYVDLRNALIESREIEIRAWVIMGGATITVPAGIPVEVDGFVLMGGTHNGVRPQDPIPGAPLIRVRTRGMWGGVTVRNPGNRSSHRDRHHHRHGHRRDTFDQARRYADEAMDIARTAVERALPPSSPDGHIPPMPSTDRAATGAAATGAAAAADPPASPAATPTSRGRSPADDAPATGSSGVGPTGNGTAPGNAASTTAASSANSADHAGDGHAPAGRSRRSVPTGTLTMLVSDIAGSTPMAERLGDQAWIELLGVHNEIVRSRVAKHGGTEVKAQGDGFLVVFPSARTAVLAAIAIQDAIRDYSASHPELPVLLRVGLHTGEVAVVDDDVFGQNVVVACRIAETAEPGEIVVSGLTRDLAASASDLGFDAGTDVSLKGLSQPWRVHRVVWTRNEQPTG